MDVQQMIIAVFVLLLSLVVHECAHAWAALRLGDDTALRMGRLTLNPVAHLDPIGSLVFPVLGLMLGGYLFGWAKPVPVNPLRLGNPLRDHALVAAAGPLSNLALALVSAILLGIVMGVAHLNPGQTGPGGSLVFLSRLLEMGIILNVLLAIFNLIPIPPLDGSWILLTFLRGEAAELYLRIRPFGFILIIVLLNLGLWKVLNAVRYDVSLVYFRIVHEIGSLFA